MTEQLKPRPLPTRPIILYGNGKLGSLAKEYFKSLGAPNVVSFERGVPANTDTCVAVCVVTSPYVPIERVLHDRGFKEVMPFYDLTELFRHRHPLANGWYASEINGARRNLIQNVLMNWADDVSRAHYLQFIAWHKLREEWTFAGAPVETIHSKFLIPQVLSVLHDEEIFIDAGAHHGDVTYEFIAAVEGKYKSIIAIEPDKANREKYEASFGDDKRIKISSHALFCLDGVNKFHSGLGYASQLSNTGHDYVTTYRLDSLNYHPTFIKFHLEGAELAALRGAQGTLRRSRPILAVTVYHNEDGITDTPAYLMGLLPNYDFLFRLHTWCGTGAVLYAIPKERNNGR